MGARALLVALLVCAAGSSAGAQSRPAAGPERDSLRRDLARIRRDPEGASLPALDSIAVGGRTVPAGLRVPGDVTVARGNLNVYGTIEGRAVAVGGDVIVHPGGSVLGDAVAFGGRVRADGIVGGEMRSVQGALGVTPALVAAARRSPAAATRHALAVAFGWLAVLAILAIGVLVFAGGPLDGVTEALERSFARSLLAGVVGQFAILPALVLLVVALAITILGVLLIPFAVVAFVLAVMGLMTLGFLAVARVTGASLMRSPSRPMSERGATLRALVGGVLLYMAVWVLSAAFTWSPLVGGLLRGVALALTWAAVTVGLGAAIVSRAGTRRGAALAEPAPVTDELSWQTPTPVSGVVAARRPTPVAQRREW